MLLLSDGNETQGDALAVLPALVEQGVQVFTAAPPGINPQPDRNQLL